MYVQLYVGMGRYVVGQMLNIFHYLLSVVRPHGLMVHSVNSAPGDVCSSPTSIKAVLLRFQCLFERIFLSAETPALKATTFYAQLETWIKYIHIPYDTCRYMKIHVNTYNIHADTDILHVCKCICVYIGIHTHTY